MVKKAGENVLDESRIEVHRRLKKKKKNTRTMIMGIIGLMLLVLFGFWIQGRIYQEPLAHFEEGLNIADPQARISSLDMLNEKTREAAVLFLRIAEDEGLEVKITETYRTQERQDYLYEQGRSRSGQVVTWTRNSQHTKRNAFDIAKNVRGEEYSDMEFFRKAAEIGERIGLEAGYYWGGGKQDMPHFQMNRFGRIYYPEGYE